MDPVTALGAASAAVQLLDFIAKLLSTSVAVYKTKADATSAHADLYEITQDLSRLNKDVRRETKNPGAGQPDVIQQLCGSCNGVADELMGALERLKKRNGTRWESFRVALKTVWSETEVGSLQQRIDGYRQQISLQILVHIQRQIAILMDKTDKRICSFDAEIRRVLESQGHCGDQWQSNLVQALHSLQPENFRNAMKTELRYMEISDREISIPKAYQETYEWIFNPPEDPNWSDFGNWLTGSDPLYWITGKPGAGKSTLMKFIYSNPRTKNLLNQWGADREVVSFSFFFWNSGTELQMSKEGLLRAILVQAFEKQPELTDIVFHYRLDTWTMGLASGNKLTWTELVQAFNKLLDEITRTKKVVLFLDGLDEFCGSHGELVELIRGILSPEIKACVSSRPWNVFQDAFFREPSLRLEELTQHDISLYVSSKLSTSPIFKDFESVYPQDTAQLVLNVTEKAAGVFLWVYLVVQSLLEGLSDGESLPELQSRFDALPEDLEGLFMKILKSVDPKHFEKAAQYFQIYVAATEAVANLQMITLYFADSDDPNIAFKPAERMNKSQRDLEAKLMKRRVNACTKGLLDTNEMFGEPYSITFLHRTVRDFICSPRVWASLEQTTRKDFNAKFRLAQAFIRHIKTLLPDRDQKWARITAKLTWFVKVGIHFAVEADLQCQSSQLPLLRELDSAAQTFVDQFKGCETKQCWTRDLESVLATCPSFLHLIAVFQLYPYLEATLKDAATKVSVHQLNDVLVFAMSFWVVSDSDMRPLYIYDDQAGKQVVSVLLKYGADPNAKVEYSNATIRERAMRLFGPNSTQPEIGQLFEDRPLSLVSLLSSPKKLWTRGSSAKPPRFGIKRLFRSRPRVGSC